MEIRFSRHAKRRAKLYKIPERAVSAILTSMNLRQGEHVLIKGIAKLRYPLKIVFSVEGKTITVITTYPLKKGQKNESAI